MQHNVKLYRIEERAIKTEDLWDACWNAPENVLRVTLPYCGEVEMAAIDNFRYFGEDPLHEPWGTGESGEHVLNRAVLIHSTNMANHVWRPAISPEHLVRTIRLLSKEEP